MVSGELSVILGASWRAASRCVVVTLSSEVAVDIGQATLDRRIVRFRLCEDEAAPVPSTDPVARTGVADLQERRALLHPWSPERRPRGVLERGWGWMMHRLGDAVWQDEREYYRVNEGQAWTTFSGEVGPLASWPLWPLDLLAAAPDRADGLPRPAGHRSVRVDLAAAARLMPRLLVPGPIRLSAIADVPVEIWLAGSGLASRVSVTVDGGAAWTVLELHDHGTAASVPRIDPAHIVDPGEVNTWGSHRRRGPRLRSR
jgi:hypothetical protein